MSGVEPDEWEMAAASFDDEPDHGLLEPELREAWCELLQRYLPRPPATVLDLGCGTGTLSILLSSMGFTVTGLDRSAAMLAQAVGKADSDGASVDFVLGDAASPPFASVFDVLLCRHVLWALADPAAVLARWRSLVRPGGRVVLIEGRWSTGVGLTATDLLPSGERVFGAVTVEHLSSQALWGKAVMDERYLLAAAPQGARRLEDALPHRETA